MDQISGARSHDLLACFFEESESKFRFLEEEYGYLYLSGLVEYKDRYKVIKPYNKTEKYIDEPFYAVTRYERNRQAIEIFYGDTNYVLDVFVYPNSIQRLNMRDLISAARGDVSTNKNLNFLTEKSNIVQSIQWFSQAMQSTPKVLEPSDRLIERTTVMRETLLEQGVRAHLDKLVKDASIRAAEAFVHKDYKRVIDILRPYQGYLNASDLKKLRIAHDKTS